MSAAPPVRRLGAAGRRWRVLTAAGAVVALFATSLFGSDDDFPIGPMSQFAFSVKSDGGVITSHWLEADTAGGGRVKLSLDAVGTGLKRAEVEGQMSRFVHDPSLLQGIADAQRRLRPGAPRLTRVYVVSQVKTLEHGRVTSVATTDRVSWTVR
ncbi:hypothetical protein [Actinomadura parmotrematis]|uniref:Uncharacterized protein n=1 Tax=Actinomadura parmotrematis TaxID=2864039 RepID=A0ABS7G1D4_9ACTN|nr:hypothetical protein [Actinomadura parmotrematis]MBW8486517.1 hypothetical protein [Actinomadura parmotrematis]